MEEVNLVDAAYLYITESKYPRGCKESRKRAIRKKAHMFVDKVSSIYTLSIFLMTFDSPQYCRLLCLDSLEPERNRKRF